MKKIQFAFVILAGIALASCSHDLGYDEPTNALSGEAIDFSSGFRAVTRASYGADAAELLGNQFIVYGAKGAADGSGMSTVFDNYRVQWALNTAGTTASNTHDWEYVGIPFAAPATLTGNQTIKYWDYSTGMYRFAAYSVGKATLTTGTPAAGEVKVTAIDGNNLTTLAYALEGLEVQYYEIVDGRSLVSLTSWDDSEDIVGCITVFCGQIPVRLIDNVRYK